MSISWLESHNKHDKYSIKTGQRGNIFLGFIFCNTTELFSAREKTEEFLKNMTWSCLKKRNRWKISSQKCIFNSKSYFFYSLKEILLFYKQTSPYLFLEFIPFLSYSMQLFFVDAVSLIIYFRSCVSYKLRLQTLHIS